MLLVVVNNKQTIEDLPHHLYLGSHQSRVHPLVFLLQKQGFPMQLYEILKRIKLKIVSLYISCEN